MATVINNPTSGTDAEGLSAGVIIGIILGAVVLFLILLYTVPALRGQNTQSTTPGVDLRLNLPGNQGSGSSGGNSSGGATNY